MKINIFKISPEHIEQMLKKFNEPSVQLLLKDTKIVGDWTCDFYLSENPEVENIPWAKNYADILTSIGVDIENKIFFSAYVCRK